MKTAETPSLRDHPAYREWSDRSLSLARERTAVQARLDDAQARRLAQRDPSRLHEQAVALLDGHDVSEAGDVDSEIRSLTGRLAVLDEAVKVHRERESDVVAGIVREMKPAVRAKYLDLLRRTIPVVLALGQLAEEEVAFRRGLEAGGIPITSVVIAEPLRDAILTGPEQGSLGRWLDALRREYPGDIEVPEIS